MAAPGPQRSSVRIAERQPSVPAAYTSLNSSKGFFDLLKENKDHVLEFEVNSFWTSLLVSEGYFPTNGNWGIAHEVITGQGTDKAGKTDIIVFSWHEVNAQGRPVRKPVAVFECKGATPRSTTAWCASWEAEHYAEQLCKQYKLKGLWLAAAQGLSSSNDLMYPPWR